MTTNVKFLLITFGSILLIIFVLMLTVFRNDAPEQAIVTSDDDDINKEVPVIGNPTNLIIRTYGGEKNVKTFFETEGEYALVKDPRNTGDLELAIIDPIGDYYFAETTEGERVLLPSGDPNAIFGFYEEATISGEPLLELSTETDYFVAYPDEISADLAGLPAIPDNGASNTYLGTRLLYITNANNNVSVIAEINHRTNEQGVLYTSERVRNALGLDEGSRGNLRIAIVDPTLYDVGTIRPRIR